MNSMAMSCWMHLIPFHLHASVLLRSKGGNPLTLKCPATGSLLSHFNWMPELIKPIAKLNKPFLYLCQVSATEILHARDFPPHPRLRKRLFSQLLWSPGREPGKQISQSVLHRVIQQASDNLKSSVSSPGWVEVSKPRDRRAGNTPDRKISMAGRRPQDQGGLKSTQWFSKEFPSHCVKKSWRERWQRSSSPSISGSHTD